MSGCIAIYQFCCYGFLLSLGAKLHLRTIANHVDNLGRNMKIYLGLMEWLLNEYYNDNTF